jgi:polyferredoxin
VHRLRGRTVGYGTALLVMSGAFGYALLGLNPLEVTLVRERGELYHLQSDGNVANEYRLRILNKTQHPAELRMSIDSPVAIASSVAESLALGPGELLDLPLTLSARPADLPAPNFEVSVRICDVASDRCRAETTRYLGPTP